MDHSRHTRLSQTELTADILDGATVYGLGMRRLDRFLTYTDQARQRRLLSTSAAFSALGLNRSLCR